MRRTAMALAAAGVLWAGGAGAAQTGGLATNLGVGGLALSAGLGYAERDVVDGSDAEARHHRAAFRAQAGVTEDLDLYGLLGFADTELSGAGFTGTLGGQLGVGVRYAMVNVAGSDTRLMLDAQAEWFRSKDGSERVDHQGFHLATYLVREFGAAGRTGYFYPYGGVRVSYARYAGRGADDFTSDDFLGVFGGADYFVNPNVFFSGEVHVFDATSLYLGVGYRF